MKSTEHAELDVRPDPNRLDDNWVEQPGLRLAYGRELADAKRKVAEANAELKVTECELELAVRSDPEKYGLAKSTEGAVKTVVPTLDEYRKAKRALIESQHDADVLDAVVSAIDHRKKALEDLVQLHCCGYFAEPRAPEGARERMDDVKKSKVRGGGRRRE